MNKGERLPQLFGLALVVLLLAGCAGAQAVPAATPVPATATSDALSWDYVALGDSNASLFTNRYAKHIEADLGVNVTLHNWCMGSQSSTEMLGVLRDNQDLRSDLREAEVVTFLVSPQHFRGPDYNYRHGTCGGADNQDCLRETLTLLKADTDAIFAEVLSLRSPSDTIIRPMTYYNPVVNTWKEQGCFEELNSYWVAHNEYLIQAASEHNIPVVGVDLAFNGPDLDEDPSDNGYLSDGMHPNVEGIFLLADLHQELGYEPLAP